MRPLAVDIRLVESFAVLADELHFTRAAARLGIAQPALSQQIGRLERQLGTSLFVRAPGAIHLTAAGTALWAQVAPAMALLHSGVLAARSTADSAPTCRLRHLSSYGPMVVPGIASALGPERIQLELREASIEEQLGQLRSGDADVALFHLDPDVSLDTAQLHLVTVAHTPRFVALPLTHGLATRSSIGLAELRHERWIMPVGAQANSVQADNFQAACRRHGFEPDVVQHANSIETMLGLVASGLGICPAPWPVALRPLHDVRLVQIDDLDHLTVMAMSAAAIDRPVIRRVVAVASEVIDTLLAGLAQRGQASCTDVIASS